MFNVGDKKKLRKFSYGVKHNFDTGVIIDSDDRKKYEWNCSTCDLQGKTIIKQDLEDFNMNRKVMCPLLTYE